ncbi:hypothetical protein IMCC1989_1941 [gamma proteobacterium IMCC1989]|nr:hypothetical protein IMCC1989_1941 [gamma proteobacterium IMCC1989]
MRESVIEKKVTEYAKEQGWLSYKWSSPNSRGVPDRLYFKRCLVVVVEFKATNKKPSKLQKEIHKKLNEQGFLVHVIDSIETGKQLFTR